MAMLRLISGDMFRLARGGALHFLTVCWCGILWTFGSGPSRAADNFQALIDRIPAEANAVVAVNAETLFQTPLAVREKWKEKHADEFATTAMMLPPDARRFVLASEIDLEVMTPDWEISVFELPKDPSLAAIAKRLGGQRDRLGAFDVVVTAGNAFVTRLAPGLFGVFTPSNRQAAGRWLQGTSRRPGQIVPYLRESVGYVEREEAQIVLGLDLADVVSEGEIQQRLEAADFVKQAQVDTRAAAAVLASLRGALLRIRVTDTIQARLQLDLAKDAQTLQPIAQPLVLAVLRNVGATIPEMKTWQAQVQGSSLVLEGDLSAEGMRRILSVVSHNTQDAVAATKPETPPPAVPEANVPLAASRRYYKAATELLQGLQKEATGAGSLYDVALWMENYARRIDRLPTTNVDPDMVAYGRAVADKLREAVNAMHSASNSAQSRLQGAQPAVRSTFGYIPTGRVVNYGGYLTRWYAPFGYTQVDNTGVAQEQQKILQEETEKAQYAAQSAMADIRAATDRIGEAMVQRYGAEFSQK